MIVESSRQSQALNAGWGRVPRVRRDVVDFLLCSCRVVEDCNGGVNNTSVFLLAHCSCVGLYARESQEMLYLRGRPYSLALGDNGGLPGGPSSLVLPGGERSLTGPLSS